MPGVLDQTSVTYSFRLSRHSNCSKRALGKTGQKNLRPGMTPQNQRGSCQLLKDSCTLFYLTARGFPPSFLLGLTMGIRRQRYSSGSCPSTAGHSVHPGHRSYTHVCWSWATKPNEQKQRWRAGLFYGFGQVCESISVNFLSVLLQNLYVFSSLHYHTVTAIIVTLFLWSPESQ